MHTHIADSNRNEFSRQRGGCKIALSQLLVLFTGLYGDPIWLQTVLYANGGYVSWRDSLTSRTYACTLIIYRSLRLRKLREVMRALKHISFVVKYEINCRRQYQQFLFFTQFVIFYLAGAAFLCIITHLGFLNEALYYLANFYF